MCGARDSDSRRLADDLVVVDDQARDLCPDAATRPDSMWRVGSDGERSCSGPAVVFRAELGGGRGCRGSGASARTCSPNRFRLPRRGDTPGARRAVRTRQLLREVARDRLVGKCPRAGLEVEDVGPDVAPAARRADDLGEQFGAVAEAGRIGAMPTFSRRIRHRRVVAERAGAGAEARCRALSAARSPCRGWHRERPSRPRAAPPQRSTSTSRTISGPRVMIPNGFAASPRTSMHERVSR